MVARYGQADLLIGFKATTFLDDKKHDMSMQSLADHLLSEE